MTTVHDPLNPVSVEAGDAEDVAQLKALGVNPHFNRRMSLWQNFALGFTYLSPVVGVYTLFGFCLATGGPPMIWTYLIIALCQFLVCLVFGEVVSQFPISGGIYPWARRLVGKRWAWMAGWIYAWALCTSIAGIAVGASPFLGSMMGMESSSMLTVLIALTLIAIVTGFNLEGTRWLGRVAMFGFLCELIGALAVGAYLILFHRNYDFGVFFNTFDINIDGSYWPAFLAASLGGLFQYYGFEACGDVAEETPNPSRAIPKAMRMTIYVGGVAAMFICISLILAVPDMQSALHPDENGTPIIITILNQALGPVGTKLVVAVVAISFLSCILSLQAAASRMVYAYSHDDMFIGSKLFRRVSEKHRVPSNAILLIAVLTSALCVASYWMEDAIVTIVSFGVIGIYLSFQMIVIAALVARARGWKPSGAFRLGALAWPVNIAALVYGVLAVINMAWPRGGDWNMIVSCGIVLGVGFLYMLLFKPYDRGISPHGDAHILFGNPEVASASGGETESLPDAPGAVAYEPT
ncbi:MAG: amino acid permease [Zoogloeaceae bacterium]|jgi:amino acid transporter|nr:amino acid permease [Zoogloeaceae bacterium]